MSNELDITSANFQKEVLDSPIPVLLDFWAEWCMPCRAIAPSVDQLAAAYAGKLKVGKVNVDVEAELAGKFSINSIPTLMVFKGGEMHAQKVGALPKHDIEALFKNIV